jgi:hypothetical protein
VNIYISGILRIVLLEASCALLVLRRVTGASGRYARRVKVAFVVLAALSLFSFTNFGALRGGEGLVNHWEQDHFYFGSKYLKEVGYFDLYKAILLVDAESSRIATGARRMRDLRNFEEISVTDGLADRDQVRARFSDERWSAFKADWVAMGGRYWNDRLLLDHGNTGSPAWAIFAAPLARACGSSVRGQEVMAWADLVLMLVLFTFVWRTFGGAATCVAVTLWALTPFCFDYLGGSLLRWDWLFASGMALCFYKRERPFVAGAFLGYAVASKLFPIAFGVAWLIRVSWGVVRTREVPPRALRFVCGGAVAIALAVTISSAAFGGPRIWRQYAQRIEVTEQEKFYGNQYSFRTVFLQVAASGPREFIKEWAFPSEIEQAAANVNIGDYKTSFFVARLLFTVLIAFALIRMSEVEALAMGPLLTFVWLMVNAYYWNMLAFVGLTWALSAFRRDDRTLVSLLGLHGVWASFYFYLHFNPGGREGYFVACLLAVLIAVWATTTGIVWPRRRGEPT